MIVRRPESQNTASYQVISFEQAKNWYEDNFSKFLPGSRRWSEIDLIEQHALMAVMQAAYTQGKKNAKENR